MGKTGIIDLTFKVEPKISHILEVISGLSVLLKTQLIEALRVSLLSTCFQIRDHRERFQENRVLFQVQQAGRYCRKTVV